jgi:hypothetical protein
VRVLVAIEDDYRAYREVIAASLRVLRPQVEAAVTAPEALGKRIRQFDPDMVICSYLGAAEAHPGPAWVELPIDPMRPARVRLSGRYSELPNPTMETLLAVVDHVERTSQG